MHFASVLAIAACVFLSVSSTCGRRWSKWTGKGAAQGGEYVQTIVRRRKFPRLGLINRGEFSRQSTRLDLLNYEKCEDEDHMRCQKILNSGLIRCEEIRHHQFRRRIEKRCRKTCGLCGRKERRHHKRKEVDVMRRRNQPFPQFREFGDDNTPRSGVYYIFTRQVSL